MKNLMVTEFVTFKALETTTDEQLIVTAEMNVRGFHQKQDGYIDAELVKDVEENAWCFIFHYESLEKIKVVGEKLRQSKEFAAFVPLVDPSSIRATFHYQLGKW